jgi:GT2 family glycosyltransferase
MRCLGNPILHQTVPSIGHVGDVIVLKGAYPPEDWRREDSVRRNSSHSDESAMPDSKADTRPSFYCVTVNYRSKSDLKRLIDSLAPVKSLKSMIVVNHSPEDSLGDLEAPFPIQIIDHQNKGYGAGLNRGLREIRETNAVVLLCNPDVHLEQHGAIVEALDYMDRNRRIGCLVPNIVNSRMQSLHPGRRFYTPGVLVAVRSPVAIRNRMRGYRNHLYIDVNKNRPMEVDWGSGAAMLYRIGALPGPDVFDEKFFLYMEDVDLCARLWMAAHSVVFYPKVVFSHLAQRGSSKKLRFFGHHLSSLIKFCLKYRGLPQLDDLRCNSNEPAEKIYVSRSI